MTDLTLLQAVGLFVAAAVGGAINAVAGGGSFVTLPMLMLYGHVPAVPANATSTVALWPGSIASARAYRKELQTQRDILLRMGLVSLLGGVLGSLLLLHTKNADFVKLLPWLLFGATLVFTFGGAITKFVKSRVGPTSMPAWVSLVGTTLFQFVIAVYGGYFGGGIGILMLATLALMGMEDIHTMNALKTLLASLINGAAVVLFIAYRAVYWPQACVMLVGAILGGFFGADYAKRIPPLRVRQFVILVGFGLSAYYFMR